jgi:glycosyltransferase involved in cell wall biosynthesis
MTFLSIIIPCYNVERYILSTLNSLSLLNDAKDCEFIFVNDGSTDKTSFYIQEFAKKDNRAILIDQPNQGVSVARNAALKRARGKFILCLDGDDYLHSDTIHIIKNNLKDADALLAPCIVEQHDTKKTRVLNIRDGVYSIEQLYTSCKIFPTAPMIVYRTSIIHENHIHFNPNIKSGEVYDFTVSFFEHAHTIAVTNVGFYYYVMRNNSATHQPNYSADLSVLAIAQHFSSIPHKWSQTTSFLLTELKMITSFTYNKYIRNGLTDKDTINTLSNVFENQYFQVLLSSLIDKSIDFKHKLYIIYLQYMPHKLGYFLCAYVGKMNKNIKNLLHQKKSCNFAG